MDDILHCTFCGHTQEQVRRLAGGMKPDVFICDECAIIFDDQMKEHEGTDSVEAKTGDNFLCSFCGNIRESYRLAAQVREQDVFICDKCLEVRCAVMEDPV